MQRILAPYGEAETWSGDAGPCQIAVAAHQHDRAASRRSAMAVGAGGTLVACVDAHLHRRSELIQWLGAPQHATDAELVLAAYERWGESFVDRLSGSFAIVIVDRRRGGTLLVRDHAGDRPLAAHERDGVLAFATTALALTGFTDVGHELDLERATEAILLAYGTDRTFVRGVRSVPPGTAMWIDGGGIRRWRWWLPQELPIDDAGSLAAHASALREALEVAVASTLQGADKVGVMMSGGLDSTSVGAVAARQLAPATLTSYTSVPPAGWRGTTAKGWIPDERFAVRALARELPNLRPQFVEAPAGSLFAHNEALWELGSGPAHNALNLIWLYDCYQRAGTDGIDVVLTGSSGNLAFSADGPLWLAELARRGRFIAVAREASQFASAFGMSSRKVVRRHVVGPLLAGPNRWRSTRERSRGLADWIGATAIRPERLAAADLSSILPELTNPHPLGFTRDTGRMFSNGAAQAELLSAVTALWGIELRDPTADRHLIELAVTQPEWWRRHKGERRAIARAAMREVLPTEIVDRQTLGAQLPDWLDRLTSARAEVLDELDAMRNHPASCEIIDVARLDGLAQAWPDRAQMANRRVVYDYQLALSRAMLLSRYLRWFEDRARRVRAGGLTVVLPS